MSLWTTKSTGKDRNYVVIQHPLKGTNNFINGIKFREGYAVVEKDTKNYKSLRQISILRTAKEFPLVFLKQLKFITKSTDVRTVYGMDVYEQYIKELVPHLEEIKIQEEIIEQKLEIEKHIETNKCSHITMVGDVCTLESLEYSPSGYCVLHLLQDPKLPELGLEVPKFLTKQERKALRIKIINKLQKK